VRVFLCICIYIYICIYVYISICVYMYICIYVYMYICILHKRIHVLARNQALAEKFMNTHTHTLVRAYTHIPSCCVSPSHPLTPLLSLSLSLSLALSLSLSLSLSPQGMASTRGKRTCVQRSRAAAGERCARWKTCASLGAMSRLR